MLFGLATCALTRRQVESLDVLQRRMLRSIVGWVRVPDEPWDDTMRRMRHKVARATSIFPIPTWTSQLARHKFGPAGSFMQKAADWPARAIRWDPSSTHPYAHRGRGRPQRRWDDDLALFATTHFPGQRWFHAASDPAQWNAREDAFVASMTA